MQQDRTISVARQILGRPLAALSLAVALTGCLTVPEPGGGPGPAECGTASAVADSFDGDLTPGRWQLEGGVGQAAVAGGRLHLAIPAEDTTVALGFMPAMTFGDGDELEIEIGYWPDGLDVELSLEREGDNLTIYADRDLIRGEDGAHEYPRGQVSFVRFRVETGLMFLEVSTDGAAWQSLYSEPWTDDLAQLWIDVAGQAAVGASELTLESVNRGQASAEFCGPSTLADDLTRWGTGAFSYDCAVVGDGQVALPSDCWPHTLRSFIAPGGFEAELARVDPGAGLYFSLLLADDRELAIVQDETEVSFSSDDGLYGRGSPLRFVRFDVAASGVIQAQQRDRADAAWTTFATATVAPEAVELIKLELGADNGAIDLAGLAGTGP